MPQKSWIASSKPKASDAIGWLAGGPDRGGLKAMALRTAVRHKGVGMIIATSLSPGTLAAVYGMVALLGADVCLTMGAAGPPTTSPLQGMRDDGRDAGRCGGCSSCARLDAGFAWNRIVPGGGSSVAYEIIRIDDDALSARISGIMKLADQKSLQTAGMGLIARGKKLRLLVTLENFQGWEKGVDWGDVDFFLAHGNDIARIAVVGDERWKEQVFAFLGKGFRTTEIEFFPPSMKKRAEDWLRE